MNAANWRTTTAQAVRPGQRVQDAQDDGEQATWTDFVVGVPLLLAVMASMGAALCWLVGAAL
jgi:hypothetical protein